MAQSSTTQSSRTSSLIVAAPSTSVKFVPGKLGEQTSPIGNVYFTTLDALDV